LYLNLTNLPKGTVNREHRMEEKQLPEIVKRLYAVVAELEAMFPGRHFTPDGHMVGSIGEALANYYYGFDELFKASFCGHDGRVGTRQVQVKATQKDRIAISCEPQHLLVLRLYENGKFEEIYNGPGNCVWDLVRERKMPKNGQHQISLRKLAILAQEVPIDARIPRVLGA
jgi:hypothetical protein